MVRLLKNIIFLLIFIFSFTYAQASIELSKEEQAYLDSKPYLSVMSLKSFHPFNFRTNNQVNGYSVDVMKKISTILNKDIKFIKKPFGEQLEMFKNGELDIIPHFAITEERRKFIDYTDFVHLNFLIGFATKKNSNIKSMKDLNGKTVAVVDGTYIHSHIKKNFPNINIFSSKNFEELISKLAEGNVDALIDNLPTLNFFIQQKWLSNLELKTFNDFKMDLETKMPMAVTKGNLHLKSILEKANRNISQDEFNSLKTSWSIVNEKDSNELNFKEKQFLENNPIIRFRTRSVRPPFEYFEDGEAKGIAVDYIKLISEKVGFEAKFIKNDDPSPKAFKEMETSRKTFDTFLFTVKNPQREKRFNFGDVYLSYPMMIISNKESDYIGSLKDLNGKTVAIETGYLTNKWIKRDYPSINIKNVSTTKDAITLVHENKVHAYIGNMAIANFLSVYEGLDNIKIAAPTEYGNINYSFIAPKEWPELVSILSKGYREILPQEHTAIQQKWFSYQTFEKVNYTLIFQILIASLIVITIFIIWNRKLQNAKDNLEATKKILQERKDELEAIFDSTQEGVAIINLNGDFLFVNCSYEKLTGYTSEELLCNSCVNLTSVEDLEEKKSLLSKVISGEKISNFEKKCIHKNGTQFIVNMSMTLLPDNQRILISTKDITQIKQTQEQAKLASLGEMIGNIAHQWRQPLSVITSYASGLKLKQEFHKSVDDSYIDNCSSQIILQAEYLSKTIDDFRNFIKEDEVTESLSLKDLVNSSLNILNSVLEFNNMKVILALDEDVIIKGNKNELSQALINIINNSKDAMNENSIQNRYVFINSKRLENSECELIIKDSAGGIPKDIIEKVLEPYFTTKHKSIGTGIGLSMVDQIIRTRHKAKLSVENAYSKYNDKEYYGAQFKIIFKTI